MSMASDYDYEIYDGERLVQCKYCKTKNLHWINTDYGWRLFHDSGKQHICNNNKSKQNEDRNDEQKN